MLENWVWQKESWDYLQNTIKQGMYTSQLVDKMLAAKNINSGTKGLQQVFYGILDFTLNDGYDPDGKQTSTELVKQLQNEVTLYPYQKGTNQQASFGIKWVWCCVLRI